MENKIKSILSSILEIEVSSINDNTSIDNVEKWDSLAHMNIVSALEDEFDVVFDEDDIEIMMNFKNICKVVTMNLD